MALSTIVSALEGTVVVSLDVSTSDAVTAVSVVNNSSQTATVDVTRPSGSVASRSVAPGGTASVSIAKGKQFTYSAGTSDWTVSLTMG